MYDWVDVLSLAWVVPTLLDSMTTVASGVYDYFVGNGIIYAIIWGCLLFYIVMYLVKMYWPQNWLSLFGFSGGGEMAAQGGPTIWNPDMSGGKSMLNSLFKPMLRVIFASAILLQIRPEYVTKYIIDPFLAFGSVYSHTITSIVMPKNTIPVKEICKTDLDNGLFAKQSCEYLAGPMAEMTAVNNDMFRKGWDLLTTNTIVGALINAIPVIGVMNQVLNFITGIFMILTFLAFNVGTAIMIIQGIIQFGLALIFLPFRILIYVISFNSESEGLIDPWPPFAKLIESLQKLVVSLIAVAFILVVNVTLARGMFHFDTATGPDFGAHALAWLYAILTFWIMIKTFKITDEQMQKYTGGGSATANYEKVIEFIKGRFNAAKEWTKRVFEVLKDKKK